MLLLAPGVQEAIKEETSAFAANNMETGGILVGKWLDRQTILIVAATDAGPNADHRQLTFAIDVDYANDELERIAAHFEGVDYVGDWHKHPPILEYPSSGDLSTILSMFRDPTTPDRLVTPITVFRNGKPLINWFYISRSTRQFERLRPKILSPAELRQVVNVTSGDAGYAPRSQVKEKAPGWWLSPTGIFRLKQEADLLGRTATVVHSQPEGGRTFIFEVAEDGLKIQFQCGGQYDQGETPFVSATYKGQELPPDPRLAVWDSNFYLWQVVEFYRKEVKKVKRRPLLLVVGLTGVFLLLVAAVVLALSLANTNTNNQLDNINAANTAAATQTIGAKNIEVAGTIGVIQKNATATAVVRETEIAIVRQNATGVAAEATIIAAITPIPYSSQPQPVVHLVVAYETLSVLELKYNSSREAIFEANKNSAALGQSGELFFVDKDGTKSLIPGTKLVIPVAKKDFKGEGLIVQPGQTLANLAQKYGTTEEKLKEFNNLSEVKEGIALLIPKV